MTATGIHSPRTGAWLGVALAAGLVLATGCTSSSGTGGLFQPGELRLVSFDSCEAAATQLRAAALDHVGPWGFGGGLAADGRGMAEPGVVAFDQGDAAVAEAPQAAPAVPGEALAAPRAAEQAAPAHSGTNVHEAGVDEPDLVKTDGRRIVTVADGVLRVVDAQRRVETGKLALDEGPDWVHQGQVADLLLHGDRALVLFQGRWWGIPMPMPVPDEPAEDRPGGRSAPVEPAEGSVLPMPEPLPDPIAGPRLLLVDLTGQPRVIGEYTVDGTLVDARAVGPTVRVVVRSGPRFEFPTLRLAATERERLAANRQAVAEADISAWLPRFQHTTFGDTSTGKVDCTAVSRPASYSGTSLLTVLTFDLAATVLGDGAPVSVVADGDTVYSNGTSLYVASDQRWRAMPGDGEADARTEIYKFDLSQPGPPRYVAAGAVDGWLINQYAMSEWGGHLRVATTSGDVFWWGGEEPDSESAVYVLAEQGGSLVEVGSVGGLGHGERIYSVRFAGSIGYVVTFRETDPFYTVDLSDPTAPAVLGELKITGYSAYLHPIDTDRVLGIGQEADLRGVVQGTQVSMFDVSDLADPRLRAQHHVRHGHSEAEFDPHAFLWWPAERLLVVPLTTAPVSVDRGGFWAPEHGALVLRVDDDGFTELDLITHPPAGDWERTGQIRRSLVIDDTLWTVSWGGLQANELATLATVAWLPFR
jgi:hypothetical protein